MGEYIFITTEGTTYLPESDSSEPDIENLQVIGFAEGETSQDALKNLLEQNDYLVDTKFDEIIAILLAENQRHYFSLKAATIVNVNY